MDNTPGDKLGVWRDMRLADALVFRLDLCKSSEPEVGERFSPSAARFE